MNNDNINKKSDSFNFTDLVKKINSDAEGTPWYKKKVSIISMSSVLGVGALATVIAVPIALTSSSSTIVLPPTSNPDEAFANFDKLTKEQKIDMYNSIMADATNNTAIKKYILESGGMVKFFESNIEPITTGNALASYNAFKTLLPTLNNQNVTFTPANGSDFLKMKGIGIIDSNSNTTTNVSDNNIYCVGNNFTNDKIGSYKFLSPIRDSIIDVRINKVDFSIEIDLSIETNIENNAFQLVDKQFQTHLIQYRKTIKFSNTSLFPGMSDFVKTKILSLTT